MRWRAITGVWPVAAVLATGLALGTLLPGPDDPDVILNVSYDPTRELYAEINEAFVAEQAAQGRRVRVDLSNGGSSTQARAVLDGLKADVVTLALWNDVDALQKRGRLLGDDHWDDRERNPLNGLPYLSTIVFVVRQGNPRQVRDWADLTRGEVQIITPNPKTSGNGRLSFLAVWGACRHAGQTDDQARAFVEALYRNVPKLDQGARGSTMTFQQGLGDVHLTWENEAYLEVAESKGRLEIVYPTSSIQAEPYVAYVKVNAERKGTERTARAYLEFLYTPRAQEILARHHYRPNSPQAPAHLGTALPPLDLFPVTATGVSGWRAAQERFFKDGGEFDQLQQRIARGRS
jgi:sulfate/thiosulfate-binding protein